MAASSVEVRQLLDRVAEHDRVWAELRYHLEQVGKKSAEMDAINEAKRRIGDIAEDEAMSWLRDRHQKITALFPAGHGLRVAR
jgi:hypothetical protein